MNKFHHNHQALVRAKGGINQSRMIHGVRTNRTHDAIKPFLDKKSGKSLFHGAHTTATGTDDPTTTPAYTPQSRIAATEATLQKQLNKPAGKNLHFVNLTSDEVGTNGFTYNPEPFQEKHIPE